MKSIFASKTFWVNLITAVVSVLEEMGIINIIPAEYQMYFISGLALLNILLRMVTSQAVTIR